MNKLYLPISFLIAVIFLGGYNLPGASNVTITTSTLILLLMWVVYLTDVLNLRNETLSLESYLLPVIGFFVIGVISLIGAMRYFHIIDVFVSFLYLVNFCIYLASPPVIANHISDNKDARYLLFSSFVLSLVMMVALAVMVVTGFRFHDHTVRIAGHEPLDWHWDQSQLALGMFLATLVSVSSGLLIGTHQKTRDKILLLTVAVLGSFLTFATLSRSSMAALCVGLFVVVFTFRRRFLIIFPATVVILPNYVVLRLERTFSPTYIPELGTTVPISMSKRLVKWVLQLEIFSKNIIIGTGFALERFRAVQVYGYRVAPDNQYVGLLAGTGMLGFAAFSYWVLYNIRLISSIKESKFQRAFATGVLGAFMGFLAWGTFQGFYARSRVLGILAIYLGIIWHYWLNDIS